MGFRIPFFDEGRWELRDIWSFVTPDPAPDKECHAKAREELGTPWEQLNSEAEAIGAEVIDLRTKKKRTRGRRRGTRSWEVIRGVCVHQMAARIADPYRMDGIPAHGGIFDDAIVVAHPPTAYLWHGHAANRNYIGLEISCRAAGIEGNPKTFWLSKKNKRQGKTAEELWTEATDKQLKMAFILCQYWCRISIANDGGMLSEYVYHRNTHYSRVSDPGSRIAQILGGRMNNELTLGQGLVLGSGKVTPTIWHGEPEVPYSYRVKGY